MNPVFDESGRLSIDAKAAKLIEGMPPGTTADTLEDLERQYQEWKSLAMDKGSGWRPRLIWELLNASTLGNRAHVCEALGEQVFYILRAQIAELALAYATEVNGRKARAAQDEFYTQYTKMVAQHRQFRSFLFDHFPEDLKRAEANPMLSLVDLSITIMLRQKEALENASGKP